MKFLLIIVCFLNINHNSESNVYLKFTIEFSLSYSTSMSFGLFSLLSISISIISLSLIVEKSDRRRNNIHKKNNIEKIKK